MRANLKKKLGFLKWLKEVADSASLISSGRSFQSRGAQLVAGSSDVKAQLCLQQTLGFHS